MGNVYQYRSIWIPQILENFDEFGMNFDEFWWILMNFDEFWWILMNFDEFWWILMKFDEFWWILMFFIHLIVNYHVNHPRFYVNIIAFVGQTSHFNRKWSSSNSEWIYGQNASDPLHLRQRIPLDQACIWRKFPHWILWMNSDFSKGANKGFYGSSEQTYLLSLKVNCFLSWKRPKNQAQPGKACILWLYPSSCKCMSGCWLV